MAYTHTQTHRIVLISINSGFLKNRHIKHFLLTGKMNSMAFYTVSFNINTEFQFKPHRVISLLYYFYHIPASNFLYPFTSFFPPRSSLNADIFFISHKHCSLRQRAIHSTKSDIIYPYYIRVHTGT